MVIHPAVSKQESLTNFRLVHIISIPTKICSLNIARNHRFLRLIDSGDNKILFSVIYDALFEACNFI